VGLGGPAYTPCLGTLPAPPMVLPRPPLLAHVRGDHDLACSDVWVAVAHGRARHPWVLLSLQCVCERYVRRGVVVASRSRWRSQWGCACALPRCSMMPRMCAGGVGGLSPLGWTGPGGVRYGSCGQRVRVRGSASWPECMCIVHPHAPPLRLHNAMDVCFDTEVVQGSGEQCVPTGGHGLWWPQ